MKRIAILLTLLLAASFAGTTGVTGTTEHCPAGWNEKVEANADELNDIVLPKGTEFCVKGSTIATDKQTADGKTTLGEYLPGKWDVSYYVLYQSKPKPTPKPTPTPEPKGPDPEMYGRKFGPSGDPFYRFVFFNPGETNGTCFVKVNGSILLKKRIPAGQGFKTGWRFITGGSHVKMACWSDGERVWHQSFRAAPPGYYGPLYRGYQRGYFPL